jgi:hypothetical protein
MKKLSYFALAACMSTPALAIAANKESEISDNDQLAIDTGDTAAATFS